MNYHDQDIDLYYECIGEGKPIVFLHGLGCDHRLMKGCMEPIFEQVSGYQRIYVDLPGMGQSIADPNTLTADRIVEALVACTQHIAPSSFLLAGESYGGYLARGVLAKLHERIDGVFFLCPVIQPIHALRNVPSTDLQLYDNTFLNTLSKEEKKQFCEHMVIANKDTYARYQSEILSGVALCDHACIHHLEKHYACKEDIDQFLKELAFSKPSLFLCGRQDTCVGYLDALTLLEDYPRASFAILDIAGHNLQIEQAKLLEEHILNWLLRVQQEEIR